MGAYEQFSRAMLEEARGIVARFTAADEAAIVDSMLILMGHPSKHASRPRGFDRHEQLRRDLVLQFGEIRQSAESLRDIETYLRKFPYAVEGVSHSSYLRYHFENYLSELYVLKERLCAYLTLISRRYRSDRNARQFRKVIDAAREMVEASLEKMIRRRGAHVHEQRYDDTEFGRLHLFELLARGDATYKKEFAKTLREVRRAKRDWIRTNNEVIFELLDHYADAVLKLLFKDGTLRFPQPPEKK